MVLPLCSASAHARRSCLQGGWVAFCAVEACTLKHDGILVPHVAVVVRARICIVVHRHAVDEYGDVAEADSGLRTGLNLWLQWNLEKIVASDGLRRIAILVRSDHVGRNAIAPHVGIVGRVLNQLTIRLKRVDDRRRITLHVVASGNSRRVLDPRCDCRVGGLAQRNDRGCSEQSAEHSQ